MNLLKALPLLIVLALASTACGNDDTSSTPATGEPAVAVTPTLTPTEGDESADTGGDDAEQTAGPGAIVSMSATATEMLFAIGAGDQVIAVDDTSNYPPEAPMTDMKAYTPNVEAIIDLGPDLVVLSVGGDVETALNAVGIETMVLEAAQTLDDSYSQIEQLGAATGHIGDAAELVARMQSDIESIVAEVPARSVAPTYYHELDDTLYSVTSTSFFGQIYALAGLENIADAADAGGASGGYPQLSAEYLIDADPDFIFLADTKCCGQTGETVGSRPGFEGLSAVEGDRVIELDDDIASRWGPRVVDLLRVIVDATAAAEVPAG